MEEIINSSSKRNVYIFFLFVILLLFHVVNNYYILTKSRYYLNPDGIVYFRHTIQIFQILKNIKLDLKSLYGAYNGIFINTWRPPLFCITASPFLLFGLDKNIVIMSNLIYFAILLFATYGIGKKLYNVEVGILGAFLVSMFPTVFALSRVFMLDFALTAIVALTFYLFVLNKFDSLRFLLLVGGVIGLGFLTKEFYFIFLLPILFYFLLQKDNLKNKKILRGFIISLFLGLLIAASYYTRLFLSSTIDTIFGTFYYLMVPVTGKYNINLLPHFYNLLDRQLLPLFFLFFWGSLVFCFRKKKYFISSMILILLIFFSIFSDRPDRWILPIFPYIAVTIADFILSLSVLSKIVIKRIFIMILVLFCFLQYFIISYTNLFKARGGISEVGLFSIIDNGDWQSPCEEIIKIINGNVEKNRIIFIGQTSQIHTSINYSHIIKELPIELYVSNSDLSFIDHPASIKRNFDNEIVLWDFILIEAIDREHMDISYAAHSLYRAFKRNFDKFNFIKTVIFPSGSLCYIYKNKDVV